MPVVLLAVLAVLVARATPVAGALPAPAGRQGEDIWYEPPVDAPVTDPFRPPVVPYGPGNRGLEYDTVPGDPVRATAPGRVTFAGPVAGALHVTVLHPDGIRTSYSFLADVTVAVGAHVERGDRLGTAGERLHLGARAGDAYLDPAALFGDGAAVELVPFEVAPGSTPDAERRALVDLTLGRGPHLVDLRAAASWLADRLAVRPPGPAGLAMAADLVEGLAAPGPCSSGPPPAHPAAGARRVAVTVAGLGSSSGPATIDDLPFRDLGYHRGAVVRFSYAGGRTPGTGEDVVPEVAPRAYTSADTQGDVHRAASRLATLVEATAAADPEATVDLYAHSLGGLVVRLALDRLQRGGFPLSRLGIVVTLSSPHRGADLATVLARLAGRPVAGTVLDGASTRLGLDLDPDAAVLAQLAERSGVVTDLAEAGVPEGVRLLSLGARGDPIVPAPRTQVDGAVNVTLPVSGPGAHTAVVTSPAAAAEVARALADQPPGCQPWHDVLADVLVGQAVTGLESHLGAVVGASG